MARFLMAVFLLVAGTAQTTTATDQWLLEYRGEPLAVPVNCANDQIAEFGLVCPQGSPCPVYLELTSVAASGTKLFVTGNLHTDTTTLYSVLLASEDGGRTWSEPADRVRLAGLDRVFFYDDEHGWAAGHMLDGGRPRDPFFLLTTDGGRFWRKRAVFSDNRLAEIQHFSFDSGRSGVLLIDRLRAPESGSRYERYETMTGGETWMIREVSSKPIRLRRRLVRPAVSDWSIESGETGTWEVRKHEGGGSVVITEFLVEAGACEAMPEMVAEAPPESPEEVKATAEPQEQQPEVAPGGVFVVGAPRPAPKPQETKRDTDDRPTMKKPGP